MLERCCRLRFTYPSPRRAEITESSFMWRSSFCSRLESGLLIPGSEHEPALSLPTQQTTLYHV